MLPKNRPPTHPGEMLLEEFLKPLGVSQKEFAVHLGWIYARLNEIINGKRGVSVNGGRHKASNLRNVTSSINPAVYKSLAVSRTTSRRDLFITCYLNQYA